MRTRYHQGSPLPCHSLATASADAQKMTKQGTQGPGFLAASAQCKQAACSCAHLSADSPDHWTHAQAWALAKQGHQDKAIMAGIAQRMRALAPELSLQHISNVLWAFASLALLDSHTMPEVIHQAESRLGAQAFNAQQLSNLLWALAISQVCCCLWDAVPALLLAGSQWPGPALSQRFSRHRSTVQQPPVESEIPAGLLQQQIDAHACSHTRSHTSSCRLVRV